jgi:hypothetical protein
MRSGRKWLNSHRYPAIAGVLGLFLAGRKGVGPSAIRNGRPV